MDKEVRVRYAEYIAECMREALTETGLKSYPDDVILCVSRYVELAVLDDILGMPIYIIDIPSSYDVTIAILSKKRQYLPLVKAFRKATEYIDL